MKKRMKYSGSILALMLLSMILVTSCKDFLDPAQDIDITEENLYKDWYEYRSIAMGIYALQQNLVEQIVVLGELRADMLTITDNADPDLVEIYNFDVSRDNKYASPTNFFKLISACNNFLRVIEQKHPEVKNKKAEITNYDRLYGEVLSMRAWAYFNAVKIYGKVPFIHESLVTIDEIQNYVNAEGTYTDSVYITFNLNGYHNDTLHADSVIQLEKNFYDLELVVDKFSYELENIKAIGVDYMVNNSSEHTWEVTTWNSYAVHALLGDMYLSIGNLNDAAEHFKAIIEDPTDNDLHRYQLTEDFAGNNWWTIFRQIDYREHIYTVFFDKSLQQQNDLMDLFIPIPPYKYMLKPTKAAVHMFETSWMGKMLIVNNTNPSLTRIDPNQRGQPGDLYRGYGTSYAYYNSGTMSFLDGMSFMGMLDDKIIGNTRAINALMAGMDTVVLKYVNGQDMYDEDICFPIYRAGEIHLKLAEVYNYWVHWVPSSTGGAPTLRTELNLSMGLVNFGEYYGINYDRDQYGVRGRVGYGTAYDAFDYANIQYTFDPFTNEVIGFVNFGSNTLRKQKRFEENLLDESGRELAFEGHRFYDLMRIAKRRNDPAFLASKVAAKYPAAKQDFIYNLLLNEENWYINMFD